MDKIAQKAPSVSRVLDSRGRIRRMIERIKHTTESVRTPAQIYDEIERAYGTEARTMAVALVFSFSKGISQRGDLPDVVKQLFQESRAGRIVVDGQTGNIGYVTGNREVRYLTFDATWFGYGKPKDPLTEMIVDLAKSVHEHGGHKRLRTWVILGVLKNVRRFIEFKDDY